jgi:hypothetical protein
MNHLNIDITCSMWFGNSIFKSVSTIIREQLYLELDSNSTTYYL